METITHAYCKELGRIVTIDEARFEFLSLPGDGRARYEFFCTHPECLNSGTRVIGVNYDKPIEDSNTFNTPHFRRSRDEHVLDCPWMSEEEQPPKQPNESNEDYQRRLAKAKINDFIERFAPPTAVTEDAASDKAGDEGDQAECHTNNQLRAPSRRSTTPGMRSTTVLDRLVTSYRHAKEVLSFEERGLLQLQVSGQGSIRLVDYFVPLRKCTPDTQGQVVFGGAKFIKRFGDGALFHFIDRIPVETEPGKAEKRLVTFYIDPKTVKKARHRNYFYEIMKDPEAPKYFTIYAIGSFNVKPGYKSISLAIDDLRCVSIIRGPGKSE